MLTRGLKIFTAPMWRLASGGPVDVQLSVFAGAVLVVTRRGSFWVFKNVDMDETWDLIPPKGHAVEQVDMESLTTNAGALLDEMFSAAEAAA